MKKSLAVTLVLVFAATSSFAQSRGGGRGGGGNGGGHGGGRGGGSHGGGNHGGGNHGGGGGHAVSRGHAPGRGYSGAVARHPSPGGGYSRGHGSHGGGYYGHGSHGHRYYGNSYYRGHYGHGHSYYRGYYGYPYYGYGYGYPYYGYGYGYGYYPWAYGFGLGLSVSLGSGYADAGYRASSVAEYPSSRQDEQYVERGERSNGDGAEMAELRFVVGPGDASVYVDDEFRGLASRLVGVRVMPGAHRVEVVRPGYAVAQREVHVGRGATASVQIDLERH